MENKTTEQIIIEAARQVFVEKGYDETNMSDIAARAGINRPVLHYYFRTKERMLDAIYSDIVNFLIPKIVQILQNEEEPFFDRVGKIIDAYYEVFISNPKLPMFGIREIHRNAQYLFDTFLKISDNKIKMIREILLSEMKRGNIRELPIEFIGYAFYGLVFSPFLIHPMMKLAVDLPEKLTKSYLMEWKAQILKQLKALLAV